MVMIKLNVNVPNDVFNKFSSGEKVKNLLQDFAGADGVTYLKDIKEEELEESKSEGAPENDQPRPHPRPGTAGRSQ